MKVYSTKTFAEAIYQTTHNKSGVELENALSNTIDFLNKNQMLGKSKEILSHLEKIIDKKDGIIRAKIISNNILSKKILDELEENLKKRYLAKAVDINNINDESLLGGMKIEVNDEIIDLSLSNRLHKLQAHLIKN